MFFHSNDTYAFLVKAFLFRVFPPNHDYTALRGVYATINRGKYVAVSGQSGSGRTR